MAVVEKVISALFSGKVSELEELGVALRLGATLLQKVERRDRERDEEAKNSRHGTTKKLKDELLLIMMVNREVL